MSVGGKMASIAELFNGGTRWTVETGRVEELFEDEDGHFATVLMGAEEEEITVARAMLYVGDEYGLFLPLEKGQNVPVFIPANDPNLSPFTFGVIGANVHKVPADVLDNPDDFWLIMKEGQNLRIRTSGSANETSIKSKLVKLGAEDDDDLDRVVMWSELKTILANIKSVYDGHSQVIPIGGVTVGVAPGPVLTNAAPISVPAPMSKIDAAGNISGDKPASSVVKGVL